MDRTRSIYWKILAAAAVIYVIFTTVMLAGIYSRISAIEHALVHENAAHDHGR